MVNLVDAQKPDSTKTTMPDPMMAIYYFFMVTTIYCILSVFIMDSAQRFVAKVCYILIVVSGEFFVNLNLSESMCGIRQWKSVFFVTILPWTMIFGVLQLFLALFPGWLSPFSNTFGYLVARLMGLPDLMKSLLVDVNPNGTEASKALENVRLDNSLLINELFAESGKIAKEEVIDKKTKQKRTQDKKDENGMPVWERGGFKGAWDKLVDGQIIKPEYKSGNSKEGDTMMNKLYFFVQMKFTIAEYIWNLLAGFLVTSISYNYIINAGCAKSPKEMKNRFDKYLDEENTKQKNKKEQEKNQPTYVQNN
jgi:hypothetical protein